MTEDFTRRLAERVHDELNEFTKQNNEAAYKSGETAIRSVLFVNGGAAVAVLAFLGTVSAKRDITLPQISEIGSSLVWFASGVAVALLALVAAYFTNLYDANIAASKIRTWEHPYCEPGPKTRRYELISLTAHNIAIIAGMAALALFLVGVWDVKIAMKILAAK